MTSVLRSLDGKDLIERHPNLVAYKARCQARPASMVALIEERRQAALLQIEKMREEPRPAWPNERND
jgi:glutathione S-transferase